MRIHVLTPFPFSTDVPTSPLVTEAEHIAEVAGLRARAGVGIVVPLGLAHQLPRRRQLVGETDVGIDQVGFGPVLGVGQVLEVVGERELVDPARRPDQVVGVTEGQTVVVVNVLVLLLDVRQTDFLVEGPLARGVEDLAVKPLVAGTDTDAVAVLQVVDAVTLVLAVDVRVEARRPEVVFLRSQLDAILGLLLAVSCRSARRSSRSCW